MAERTRLGFFQNFQHKIAALTSQRVARLAEATFKQRDLRKSELKSIRQPQTVEFENLKWFKINPKTSMVKFENRK